MSSVSLKNVLASELKFYSDKIGQFVEQCFEQCFNTVNSLGDILTMSHKQVNYVVKQECIRILKRDDEEVNFVIGLIMKVIYDVTFSPDNESSLIVDSLVEQNESSSFDDKSQPLVDETEVKTDTLPVSDKPETSYLAVVKISIVDEPFSVEEKKVEKVDYPKPHFFKFVDQNTGFVDPKIVDEYLEEKRNSIMFVTKGVTEEEVERYLMKNFPRTEYYSTFQPWDDRDFRVKISFNGICEASKINSIITKKFEDREYVDIFTSYTLKSFIANLGDFASNYFITSKEIDDRITSVRFFKLAKKEFVFPTTKDLLNQFKVNNTGKVPVAFLYNMPLEIFNKLRNDTILGYKFILMKKQPEDENFRSLMVFGKNKIDR